LMEQSGQALHRLASKGRSMLYGTPSGQTVRVRTCNDHVLVAVAEGSSPETKLNIEGTDFVLIVMPETPRSPGPVAAYFVPTSVVTEAMRSSHRNWLASNPSTHGENKARAIWFDDNAPPTSNGFAKKWANYRLQGSAAARTAAKARTE